MSHRGFHVLLHALINQSINQSISQSVKMLATKKNKLGLKPKLQTLNPIKMLATNEKKFAKDG